MCSKSLIQRLEPACAIIIYTFLFKILNAYVKVTDKVVMYTHSTSLYADISCESMYNAFGNITAWCVYCLQSAQKLPGHKLDLNIKQNWIF